jgi:hypothetical protein
MAHFAKVDQGIVVDVIVAENEFFENFIDTTPGEWIQCSYNTHGGVHYNPETGEPSDDQSKALRKNYPSVGFTYDFDKDAFIEPKPYPSWILDEESCTWSAPVDHPMDGLYRWDEDTTSWVLRDNS